MKKQNLLLWLLAGILLTGCAASGDSADDEALAAEEGSDEEVICRRIEVTGTHFRRRVCQTRAEFAELDRQTQEFLDESNRRVSGASGPDS